MKKAISKITFSNIYYNFWHPFVVVAVIIIIIIPREARPKASRSGVYNFVPQRAQAG